MLPSIQTTATTRPAVLSTGLFSQPPVMMVHTAHQAASLTPRTYARGKTSEFFNRSVSQRTCEATTKSPITNSSTLKSSQVSTENSGEFQEALAWLGTAIRIPDEITGCVKSISCSRASVIAKGPSNTSTVPSWMSRIVWSRCSSRTNVACRSSCSATSFQRSAEKPAGSPSSSQQIASISNTATFT